MNKTFYIKTYGCAMNTADGNSIRNILNSYSLTETKDWRKADIIFLVTCSIRQQAEDKVSGWGIKSQNKDFNDKTVILTGCMAQRYDRENNQISEKYKKTLLRKHPWITHIINIKEIDQLPKILNIDDSDQINTQSINYDINNKYQGLFSTSHGCDNFCSYCIVPYARGELINLPKKQILENINNFISNDGKIVTLLGQNVNSWEDESRNFIDLLKEVEKIDGEFWINFLSSHPKDFSNELIDLITTHEKFLKHCNIAVQSGSDRILNLMNRRYKAQTFIDICDQIKAKDPLFRITTDAIVGFPTETDDDFNKTINLVKKCEVEMVYIGKYSQRKGTVASKMTDNVSLSIKKKREKILRECVNEIRERKHKQLLNKSIPVLMIEPNKGISYYNHEVITEKKYKPGKIYNLEVNGYSRSGLKC
ncbi:MAG: MiaB/RimO family radical SAM methylthiotransferase [Candidatus Dojkabacteria bacterium]|nr:MiaB/RimO family radical SAM methylthiotransferase [Candidatus Dojkabacteria bacterium]